jgi:hypothetical protein
MPVGGRYETQADEARSLDHDAFVDGVGDNEESVTS